MSVMSLFLNACTQAGFFAANAPVKMAKENIFKDIVFDAANDLALDIYMPERDESSATNFPVVVFFYGGSWQEGSKDDYAFVGGWLAENGYVAVIPDYRKYPDVKFPTFVEDGAKAVAWVHRVIADYQGNPDSITLMGHSAGAHTAALLTADERYLAAENYKARDIKTMIGLAGPYDFIPQAEDLKAIFGPPENYPQMQVTTFITGDEPPMVLLHGLDDEIVIKRNLDKLSGKIKEKGGRVEKKLYKGLGHVDMVSALAWAYRPFRDVDNDVLKFLEKSK